MCGCKDRDESKTTLRFRAGELCVIVRPFGLRVKEKKQKEKDAGLRRKEMCCLGN